MSTEQEVDKSTTERQSPCEEPRLGTWWNDWITTIETERASAASDERLRGMVRQLITEAAIYSSLAFCFTCIIYVLGEVTIITLMRDPLREGPLYMGSVIALLFTTMWDSWLRETSGTESETSGSAT